MDVSGRYLSLPSQSCRQVMETSWLLCGCALNCPPSVDHPKVSSFLRFGSTQLRLTSNWWSPLCVLHTQTGPFHVFPSRPNRRQSQHSQHSSRLWTHAQEAGEPGEGDTSVNSDRGLAWSVSIPIGLPYMAVGHGIRNTINTLVGGPCPVVYSV